MIDESNSSGSLEFNIPGRDMDAFFPVQVMFKSPDTLCDLDVRAAPLHTSATRLVPRLCCCVCASGVGASGAFLRRGGGVVVVVVGGAGEVLGMCMCLAVAHVFAEHAQVGEVLSVADDSKIRCSKIRGMSVESYQIS